MPITCVISRCITTRWAICSGRGGGGGGAAFYEKALELRERLVAQEPGRADYLRDFSVSYNKMGDLQRAKGEGEAARQLYEKALGMRERLVAQEPGRADYLRDLSVSYSKMGDLQRALGAGEAARQFYEKALRIAERWWRRSRGVPITCVIWRSITARWAICSERWERERRRGRFYEKALGIGRAFGGAGAGACRLPAGTVGLL